MFNTTEHITNFQFIEDTTVHPWFESLAKVDKKDINTQIDKIMLENFAKPECFSAFFREAEEIRAKIHVSNLARKSFTSTKDGIEYSLQLSSINDIPGLWWVTVIDENNNVSILYSPGAFNIKAQHVNGLPANSGLQLRENLTTKEILSRLFGTSFTVYSSPCMNKYSDLILRRLIVSLMAGDEQMRLKMEIVNKFYLIRSVMPKYVSYYYYSDMCHNFDGLKIETFLCQELPLNDSEISDLQKIVMDAQVYEEHAEKYLKWKLSYNNSYDAFFRILCYSLLSILFLAAIITAVVLFLHFGSSPGTEFFIAASSILEAVSLVLIAVNAYICNEERTFQEELFDGEDYDWQNLLFEKDQVIDTANKLISVVNKVTEGKTIFDERSEPLVSARVQC